MPHPSDSQARQRRDAALRTQDQAIADHLAQAQRSGELQSAPSFGRPLAEPDGWAQTPTEFRLPFKILRNAGVAPPEIALFHARAALRRRLQDAATDAERRAAACDLSHVEQAIALRLEGLRANGRL